MIIRPVNHRPEFQHPKFSAVAAHALLPVQDWPGAGKFHRGGYKYKERGQRKQDKEGTDHIERALEGFVGSFILLGYAALIAAV